MADAREMLDDATDEERNELMKVLGVTDEGDLEGALEEYVAAEFGITAGQIVDAERTGWNIRDHAGGEAGGAMRLADWAAQKVARAREKCAEVDTVADSQIAQIRKWQQTETQKHLRAQSFFAYVLEQYFGDFHADETSVALPCGVKLMMKKNRAYIVWDEDAALGFAHAQEMLGVINETLARTPFKERLEEQADGSFVHSGTGLVVEFVRMKQPDEERTFEVV